MPKPEPLIPKHGGYRNLKSFQVAQLAYDVTVRFCDRFISRRSRTHDQMVQAARSGVQNIAEGSQASGGRRIAMAGFVRYFLAAASAASPVTALMRPGKPSLQSQPSPIVSAAAIE